MIWIWIGGGVAVVAALGVWVRQRRRHTVEIAQTFGRFDWPAFAGDAQEIRRDRAVEAAGRLRMRIFIGDRLVGGDYAKVVIWPANPVASGESLGERLRYDLDVRPKIIEAETRGTIVAILPPGAYHYIAEWGVLHSQIHQLVIEPLGELRLDFDFALTEEQLTGGSVRPTRVHLETSEPQKVNSRPPELPPSVAELAEPVARAVGEILKAIPR